LKFNDKIKTQNGFVCGIVLQVKPAEDVSFVAVETECTKTKMICIVHASESFIQQGLKIVQVAPWQSQGRRTQTRKRSLAVKHQENGSSWTVAGSKKRALAGPSTGFLPSTTPWIWFQQVHEVKRSEVHHNGLTYLRPKK